MTTSPFDLPPGPERRAALKSAGLNVSDFDFTEAELRDLQAAADDLLADPPADQA